MAREHLIELLNAKKVELIDDERIPQLPDEERSLTVKQRWDLSFNPKNLAHFSEIEVEYATALYKKTAAPQITEDHLKARNTIELLVRHMV